MSDQLQGRALFVFMWCITFFIILQNADANARFFLSTGVAWLIHALTFGPKASKSK